MQITIRVSGMSCAHCAQRVKEAIEAVKGVIKAEIDLAQGKAVVEVEDDQIMGQIKDAIRKAGYKIQ